METEIEIKNDNQKIVNKKGRKPKYHTDEERKAAKRLQNKQYKQRKLQQKIAEIKTQKNNGENKDDKN